MNIFVLLFLSRSFIFKILKKNPSQSNAKLLFSSRFVFSLIVVFLATTICSYHLYAENIRTAKGMLLDQNAAGEQNKGTDSQIQPATNPRSLSQKAYQKKNADLKGVELDSLGHGASDFQSEFDANQTPSWSKWTPVSTATGTEETWETEFPYQSSPSKIQTALAPLEAYQTSPQEDPTIIALKIDDMIGSLSNPIVSLNQQDWSTRQLPQNMMSMADHMMASTDAMYADINGMYSDIDGMKAQLNQNYETYNNSEQTMELAQRFNALSDAMAERVAGMGKAVEGMKQRVDLDVGLIDGMFEMLEGISQKSQDTVAYHDQLTRHIKDVSAHFETMVKDLEAQGVGGSESVTQVRQYLNHLQEYLKGNKAYTTDEKRFLDEVKKYLQNSKDYLVKVLKDFAETLTGLKETEEFFRKAKIDTGMDRNISFAPEGAGADACAGAETKGLSSLKDCAKDCHRVCRWKEKVNGQDCYECPSGSPDSCWDVGAWPDNHPWCQPGGPCYDDPMMYCVPFGTIGPNLEHLSCTNCKKRDDMCWQKVGDGTMTLTNCTMSCWDGECIYKGKYQENEWDGKPELIHCYKCQTPPPPPTCEDLGWGYTWISDCKANCPEPGQCESVNTKVPGAPQSPPNNNPPGNNPPGGGQQDGQGGQGGQPAGGGQSEGTQSGGEQTAGGDSTGNKPNPPTGSSQQPGGGGTVAGGDQGNPTGGGEPGQTPEAGKEQKSPQEPNTTQPRQPQQPNTGDKPKPPEQPLKPPDNPEIAFYRRWLAETEESMKIREKIIADEHEGEYTKEEAQRQLDSMTRERDYLKKRVEEEEQKERDRQRQADEQRQREEEYVRTRPRTESFGDQMRRKEREWKLKRLKETTDALRNKLREMKDVLTGRRERLDRIDREIAQLETENQYFTESGNSGNLDSDFTKTRIKQNQDRINDLKRMRNELAKKLREVQRQFDEELQRLKTDYQRALWSVDVNSRRRAEAGRIDEYFERYNELQRREQIRELRRQTYEEMIKGMEAAAADAAAHGDSSRAEDLKRQIENMKRSEAEWDATQERQIETIKEQIRELEIRNGYEGVGPSSAQELKQKLGEYEKIFQDQMADTQKAIDDLEKLGTRTSEQETQLQQLRSRRDGLRGAVDGVQAKKAELDRNSALTDEERQRVYDSTTRVAAGAMDQDADKSFLRLAAESIAEEAVHNMNPYVMAKKSLAFGVGVVQGVGSAVAGLAQLGWEAIDILGEAAAVDLGFENGGIFGTENLDALNNAISTVSSNSNFDGVIKMVVAAGGALDAELKELEKGDIDWNTAKFGGRVSGEIIGNELTGAAVGKAVTALKGAEEVNEVARGVEAVEEAATAGRATEEVGEAVTTGERVGEGASAGTKTAKLEPFEPPGTATVDEAASAGSAAGKAEDVPVGSAPRETPPARGPPEGGTTPTVEKPAPKPSEAPAPVAGEIPKAPATGEPPRAGIGEHGEATFKTANGTEVTIRTGEELGHGATSTVYVDPNNPNRVVRITESGKGGIANAPELDAAGRRAVESIQKPDGPIRIVDKGERYVVNDPNSPLNGKIVETGERLQNGSADKFLPQQGGQMTEGQAVAFDQATRELNNNGYAWMDNHTGNYGFEKIPGTEDGWRVVVLDPGGIVPMKGATLAEKAQNARALQQGMNIYEEGTAEFFNSASKGLKENFVNAERGRIMQEFGETIDTAAMGIKSPYDIAFYPMGTLDFQNVQNLMKMSPGDAAIFYGAR